MPARAISSATVSFGLVSIPVKVYSSGETSRAVSFNLLHKDCGSRLKQQYICPEHAEKVERDDMVKGYEFTKGQYVIFTPEELKALEEKSTQAIEITEFVPEQDVDRVWLDRVYYLGPDKGGDRAYKLLSETLRRTGRSAIARYAARGKGYLVMIRPLGEGLVMEQLRYADEVRSFDEVPLGEATLKEDEIKLAVQLIEQAARDSFDPGAYHDEVKDRIHELIQKKVDGEDITKAPVEAPKTQIIDLMAALKASITSGDTAGDAQETGDGAGAAGKKKKSKSRKKKAS